MAFRIRTSLFFAFFLLVSFLGYAQDEQETWYMWIDTYVEIDGEDYRVVSAEPFVVTCCVRSPKYRKLGRNAQKWIKENVSKTIKSDVVLRNIQDQSLAETIITQAKNKADNGGKVKIVEYSAKCE